MFSKVNTTDLTSPHRKSKYPGDGGDGLNLSKWINRYAASKDDNFWIVKSIPTEYRLTGNSGLIERGYFTSWIDRSLVMGENDVARNLSIVAYKIPKEQLATELARVIELCDENSHWFGEFINTVPATDVVGHSTSLAALLALLRGKDHTWGPSIITERDLRIFKVGGTGSRKLEDGSNFWILESEKVKSHFEDLPGSGRVFTDDKKKVKWFLDDGATVQNYKIDTTSTNIGIMEDFTNSSNRNPHLYGKWQHEDRLNEPFSKYYAIQTADDKGN